MGYKIDIEKLSTREQCDEAMQKLDAVIGDIENQVRHFGAGVAGGAATADDWQWCADAKGSLKRYKRLRQRIQTHKGALPKTQKARSRTIEGHFIDSAMELLPKETIQVLWKMVHAKLGDLE